METNWDGVLVALMSLNCNENGRNRLVSSKRTGLAHFQGHKRVTVPGMTKMNENELFHKYAPIESNEVGIAWYRS